MSPLSGSGYFFGVDDDVDVHRRVGPGHASIPHHGLQPPPDLLRRDVRPLRPLLRISVGGYDWAVRFFPTEATAARWRFSSSS
jgi:hypothetical protein